MATFRLGKATIQFIQRGWHNCNTIVVQGADELVVIDTGSQDDAASLLTLLQAHGIPPQSVTRIVNTHGHWDHHGGNSYLQAESGAEIWMGGKTAAFIQANDRRSLWLNYFNVDLPLAEPDQLVDVGQSLTLAGVLFETIPAAGHAPDMFVLYQPELRLLISSDALHAGGDCGIINVAVHGEQALAEAQATTARLQALDVQAALPGHGPIVSDVAGDLEKLAARLARFAQQPEKLAMHLNRRILMAMILQEGFLSRAELVAHAEKTAWAADYVPDGQTAVFINSIVDQFVARGVVEEIDGRLRSNMRR